MKLLFLLLCFVAVNAANAESSVEEKVNKRHFNFVSDFVRNPLLIDSQGNYRDKSLINASVGVVYQNAFLNDFSANTYVHNQSFMGTAGDVTLNVTGKLWLKFAGEGLWSINVPKGDGVVGTNNSDSEIKFVIGYDIFSIGSTDISVYGGFFDKMISTNIALSGGLRTIYATDFLRIFPPYATNIGFNDSFIGGVLGVQFTSYISQTVNAEYYLEGYLTSFVSRMNGVMNLGAVHLPPFGGFDAIDIPAETRVGSGSYSSFAGGIGFGTNFNIQIHKNIWMRPYAKLQAMFAPSYGDSGSNMNRYFVNLNIGLNIGWM